MGTSKPTIKDVYDIVLERTDNLEAKFDKYIEAHTEAHTKIHERINGVRSDVDNMKGASGVISFVISIVSSFLIDLIRKN